MGMAENLSTLHLSFVRTISNIRNYQGPWALCCCYCLQKLLMRNAAVFCFYAWPRLQCLVFKMIWIGCNQNNMYPPEGFFHSGSDDPFWSVMALWSVQAQAPILVGAFSSIDPSNGFWRQFFRFWSSNAHACVQGWCLPPYCSLASIILSLPAILWYGEGLRNHIAQTLLEFSFIWISSLKISAFTSLRSLPFTGRIRSAVATPKNSAKSRQFSWTCAALSMTINLLISLYTCSRWRLRNS